MKHYSNNVTDGAKMKLIWGVIFLIIFLLASLIAGAQITEKPQLKRETVGENKQGGFHSSLVSFVGGEDTTYALYYRNNKYKTIADIRYIDFAGTETCEQLYQLLKSILQDEGAEQSKVIQLGKTDVSISRSKTFGVPYVQLYTEDGYFTLTGKMLDRLFNK